MPYYTDNTGIIKSTKTSSLTGVYDIDYARQNKVTVAAGPLIAINFALSEDNSSNTALPGTQARYAASPGTIISTTISYSFNAGYHYFTLQPGTYAVVIKGAEGSGNHHGLGTIINATLVVTNTSRFVALVGNYGTGAFGGGGMTAIAVTNSASDIYTSATAILVAGGGGGGYSITTQLSWGGTTANDPIVRRGIATDNNNVGVYDSGAAFYNVYNPSRYGPVVGVQGDVGAQHFVWGGLGGRATSCGTSSTGGFGGGGGSCPGGGGGYYGGKGGGDTPAGSPGGGGTSYRLATPSTSYISSWSDGGGNGNTGPQVDQYSYVIPGIGGFFSITPA